MRTLLTACIIFLLPILGFCQDTAPRTGLALLPLLHPNFPVGAAKRVLAQTERPSIAFLYGPFGTNPRNILSLVDGLPGEVQVQIYLLSGPTRTPRAKINGMQDFYKELPISHFNRRVANDVVVQRDFRERVLRVKEGIVDQLPNVHFILVPELEDNLTRGGRSQLVATIKEVFSGYEKVTIRTNPLPLVRTEGFAVETHDPHKIKRLTVGDAFSEDGLIVSNRRTQKLIEKARTQGADYYLWRCEWQGTCSGHWRTPERRVYAIKNSAGLVKLLNQR